MSDKIPAPVRKLPAVQDSSAERLIQQAITAGTSVDVMERLLAMRAQLRSENAREAFDRAMANFQAECPTIVKTKEVKSGGQVLYRYAPIESIVEQVKPYLKGNGFSYRTQVDLTDTGVRATIHVKHELGHAEGTSMEVPLGNKTGIMSSSQQTAAASTFAKRYAFLNAFGILTADEDNDGADLPHKLPATPPPIDTKAQRETLFRLLKERGVDVDSREACEAFVADETQLALTEKNFGPIIKLLSN